MPDPKLEMYLAVMDDRVCPLCAPLHRSIWPAGAGPMPPIHPYCRCKRVPVPIESIEPGMLTALGLRQRAGAFANDAAAAEAARNAELKRLAIAAAIVGAAEIAAALAEEEERRRRKHK